MTIQTVQADLEGCNPRDGRLTLRDLRKMNGYSIKAVAAETGIDAGTLSRLERGHMTPRADQLLTLADLYGVHIADFIFVAGWELPVEKVPA